MSRTISHYWLSCSHPEWIQQTHFCYQEKLAVELRWSAFHPKELYKYFSTSWSATKMSILSGRVEGWIWGKRGMLFILWSRLSLVQWLYSSCNKILWNEISSKTRVGMPCIGCTEIDFPTKWYTRNEKIVGILLKFLLVFQKSIFKYKWCCKNFKIDRLIKLME